MFEIKSRSQLKLLLKQLVSRGKLETEEMNIFVSKVDLPEGINPLEGESRTRLGGLRSPSLRSTKRKGDWR